MKNQIEEFIEQLEKEMNTNPAFRKMNTTELKNKKIKIFNFFYLMKNGSTFEFVIHYEGDFLTVHHFSLHCFVNTGDDSIYLKEPPFISYFEKHQSEMNDLYQHFIRCFEHTIENNSYLRLYYMLNSNMVKNNIENKISFLLH